MSRTLMSAMNRQNLGLSALALIWIAAPLTVIAAEDNAAADTLAGAFINPPQSAGCGGYSGWDYFHVTKEGISREMREYAKMGFAAQNVFTHMPPGQYGFPKESAGPVAWHTPAWDEMIVHAAREAHANGIKFGLHLCSGQSPIGGPWITPELSMRTTVTAETDVDGGKTVEIPLPLPTCGQSKGIDLRNIAVLAFPASCERISQRGARYTTFDGKTGGLTKTNQFSFHKAAKSKSDAPSANQQTDKGSDAPWIEIVAETPFTARTLTLACGQDLDLQIESSDNGKVWKTVASYNDRGRGKNFGAGNKINVSREMRVALPTVTSKFFRILFGGNMRDPVKNIDLLSDPSVEDYWGKALYMFQYEIPWQSIDAASAKFFVDPKSIIDLTDKVSADSVLRWDAPPGRWTILRVGHVSTGSHCHGGVPGVDMGLATDILSAEAIRHDFNSHIRRLHDLCVKSGAGPIDIITCESWEMGPQNWTPKMPEEFKNRRGYDLRPYLVTLSGRIVGNSDTTDRFLRDLRLTIDDLVADNFFKLYTQLAHENGMETAVQIYGNVFGEMWNVTRMAGLVDRPELEFWGSAQKRSDAFMLEARVVGVPEAAQAAGKQLVPAESWTAPVNPQESPRDNKLRGDLMWSKGVSQFRPNGTDHGPYLKARPDFRSCVSQFSTRRSWWPLSEGWWQYASRAQFLLQSGQAVSDIFYFIGDDAPLRLNTRYPILPKGFEFDVCAADRIELLEVAENGDLVLPQGQRYRFLLLPPEDTMSVAVARKIRDLVQKGATVVGHKPIGRASIGADPQKQDGELKAIAESLWGDGKEIVRRVGRGRIVHAWDIAAIRRQWKAEGPKYHHTVNLLPVANLDRAFQELGMKPDLEGSAGDHDIAWIHRQTSHDDIYFLSNQNGKKIKTALTFRQDKRIPEIWDPMAATTRRASFRRTDDHRTVIDLDFEKDQSLFVIFRDLPTAPLVIRQANGDPLKIAGPWTVRFEKDLGAPESIKLDALISLSEHPESGVKYFSGIAAYETRVDLPGDWIGDDKAILLDLGSVEDIARVSVNGRVVANLWFPPYRQEIPASCFKPGDNTLMVEVANPDGNRMIGDEQLPPDVEYNTTDGWGNKVKKAVNYPDWIIQGGKSPNGRVFFSTLIPSEVQKNAPLKPSGLIGPVSLQPLKTTTAKE